MASWAPEHKVTVIDYGKTLTRKEAEKLLAWSKALNRYHITYEEFLKEHPDD